MGVPVERDLEGCMFSHTCFWTWAASKVPPTLAIDSAVALNKSSVSLIDFSVFVMHPDKAREGRKALRETMCK